MRAQKKLIDYDTLKDLLQLIDNDLNLLRRTLEEYFFSVEEGIKEIRMAYQQKRYDEISLIAHGIKGASYNVGAEGIADLAYYIEKNPISISEKEIDDLASILQKTKNEIENWFIVLDKK